MNKKTMLIGLGVLAVAGIGYYMWKKKNETTSAAANGEDESSNAVGVKRGGLVARLGNRTKATIQVPVGTAPQAFWAELADWLKKNLADKDGAIVY
jgi:hypothetical protein